MQKTTVRDRMSSPVFSIAPTTRLPRIKQMLGEHKIRHLPVIDNGRLVGIISLGDVRNAFPSDTALLSMSQLCYQLDMITAADIMRTEVITITSDAPLTEAVTLLLQHKIGCLPVLEAGRLSGILTVSDILQELLARES